VDTLANGWLVCLFRSWENVSWEANIVFHSTCRLTAKISLKSFSF